MKIVKAVAPYIHPEFLNFKTAPYEAWVKCGGQVAKPHYPWRPFHGLAYRWELPTLWKSGKEAQLRFVEPVSITFDTFPDYICYEIIPFVWDCWPCHFEKMCAWLQKHDVKTAIFTASQTAELMRQRFPKMNIMYCPEAVDTTRYSEGKPLTDRNIDLLEFGRGTNLYVNLRSISVASKNDNDNQRSATHGDTFIAKKRKNEDEGSFRYVCTKVNGKFLYTNEQLYEIMGDAKVTVALPRCDTQPEIAGDIETLTQRYWENMLSRIVMVGRAPKELVELIGYNPAIDLDKANAQKQILYILNHIEDYQYLVDRNHKTALQLGDWSLYMQQVMVWLSGLGYKVC